MDALNAVIQTAICEYTDSLLRKISLRYNIPLDELKNIDTLPTPTVTPPQPPPTVRPPQPTQQQQKNKKKNK